MEPITPKPNSIKVIVVIVLSVALFFVAGIYLGLRWQEKQLVQIPLDDKKTVSWRTYRSEKYGFEISYPSPWKVHEYDYGIALYSPAQFEHLNTFIVEGYKGAPPEDMLSVWVAEIDPFRDEEYDLFDKRKIKFASLPAYEGLSPGLGDHYGIDVEHNGNLYRILVPDGGYLPGGGPFVKNLDEISVTILSTFKFTK